MELVFDSAALPSGIDHASALGAVQRAAARWNSAAAGCSRMRVVVRDEAGRARGARVDRRSTVTFLARHFCAGGALRDGHCYDHRIAAVTTLRFGERTETGEVEILEADIELNAVTFEWTATAGGQSDAFPKPLDLEAVMVHELGHVVGLDHVCPARWRTGVQGPQGKPRAVVRGQRWRTRRQRNAAGRRLDDADG